MGIHPTNGVPSYSANMAFQPTRASSCDLYYGSNRCAVQIDIDALNAIVSELRRVVDAYRDYDCSATDNLLNALDLLVCDKSIQGGSGSPTAATPTCPQLYIDYDAGEFWFYNQDQGAWNSVSGGACTTASRETGDAPSANPAAIITPPANPSKNQTHVEYYDNAANYWCYDGTSWNFSSQVALSGGGETHTHHTGPCSDLANGLVPANALTWYVEDKGQIAVIVDGQWILTGAGGGESHTHHVGPCSDAAGGLIPSSALTWFVEDKQRMASRVDGVWVMHL